MHQIAITCLGFEAHELENEQMGVREHQWQFNFNILITWKNKCVEDDPRQVIILSWNFMIKLINQLISGWVNNISKSCFDFLLLNLNTYIFFGMVVLQRHSLFNLKHFNLSSPKESNFIAK